MGGGACAHRTAVTFGVLPRLVLPRTAKTLAEREDAADGGMARAELTREQAA